MKKSFVLAILLVSLSGCAARRPGGSGWFSRITLPPILTVVLTNNTVIPLEVFENGQPVMFRDQAGQWQKAILPPGGTVSRGFYNYLGQRDIVVTVSGICPKPTVGTPEITGVTIGTNKGCASGQYAGTASRRFYIYTDGQYHAEQWEINYLRGPRGVY